ncbi:alpha/beta hydrolase [Aeromicrobium phragmitis]|uniref:Alpha/beta hydrolase n=1 Tax=Aeromicrobium phragmitis TaxID=2478914 RepID=A0A3L8PQ76_9ACTN|nr:alpha/beta hydrolase [Aeromicrobium phragmitis]RLV57527.1 alpha/beta hydrolase [Aeromicrobium phragmitis]
MKRSVAVGVGVAVAALALTIAAALGVASLLRDDAPQATPSEPTGEQAPDGLEDFYAQHVEWRDCEGGAQCGTVEVPVDYAEPDGETLELAMRKVPATGDAQSTLFVNPGGPGGSAQEFADYLSSMLGADVREMYDVVGVDPRGVGESTPLQCLDDADFGGFIALDPDPETPDEVDAVREGIVDMGEACAQNSGELAAHVSTEEVARDHDIVRAVLGEDRLDWFGASYGTQVGATYAHLFPEKVGRMVLDGGLDPSLDSIDLSLGQAQGFQLALESYIDDCVAKGCVLGETPEQALDTVAAFMQRLEEQPMATESGRELTEGLAFYGVAVTLYAQQSWSYLTAAFEAALEDDDPSIFLQLADIYFDRNLEGEFISNSGQVIYAVNCLDGSPDISVEELEAEVLPRFRQASPIFGGALGWGVLACADWPIEASYPQEAVTAEGAAPIVVVGTTRDPATPYAWSEALAAQLESGVLVTREGDGHTGYGMGNACVDEAIDAYLVDGTVPEDGLVCGE